MLMSPLLIAPNPTLTTHKDNTLHEQLKPQDTPQGLYSSSCAQQRATVSLESEVVGPDVLSCLATTEAPGLRMRSHTMNPS